MKYLLTFAAGASLAVAAAFAWPQETPRKHGMAAHYAEIGLTSQQRASIDPLYRQFEERMGPICKSMARCRRELYGEIAKDAPDRATIDATIEAIVTERRAAQHAVVDHLAIIKPLLTPEQRARLFERLCAERKP